jgi:L,D-peptidoglycan transpeptidase YkuD (ErfK/YbiS/YcfS/YnhG family)
VPGASGEKKFVGRRYVKNDPLVTVGFLWAFAARTASPGTDTRYRRRRDAGDWHSQAQRHLFNRLLSRLYHCLQTRRHFDEHRAITSTSADLVVAA